MKVSLINQKSKSQRRRPTEESELDCSCECLDTSLSNVGDSDCSCSQCLEANLQAFNELKALEEQRQSEVQMKNTRGVSTRITSRQNNKPTSRNMNSNEQKTKSRINNYKSTDKFQIAQSNYRNKQNNKVLETNVEYFGQPAESKFSRQCINDYIKITQHRARQYMNQLKQLKKNEEQQRKKLKDMIKQNLRALKFTIQHERNAQRQDQLNNEEFDPRYRWNHKPYHCKSKVQCRGKPLPYDPDLENKKEEIQKINQRIKQYEQKTKKEKYECPDQCPRHHMRTSKKKLAEIEKFIKNKAKAYEDQKKKEKAQKEQKERIKAAKLRAIDLRCKDIVARSKKYDPDISRTSFHNSIDHFSTFSELRAFKEEKTQQKERKAKVRKAMKQGGVIEQKMYQDLSDQLIGDHPPIHSKIGTQSRFHEKSNEESQQWCQKIVKQAKIKPPKQVKKEDAAHKISKQVKETKKQQPKKSKKQIENTLRKQEQKRKQLQIEIERRKNQIFNEYQKRNSGGGKSQKEDPKNKKLRVEYEQAMKSQKSPSNRQSGNLRQQAHDIYRQNYKHQPSQDRRQMQIVGDPLMEEYEYQKNVGRLREMQVDEDHEIFTKSGTNLRNKAFLKI